jgi:hypothetical protein
MDKHQRKHLARWEQKKAKEERQFQERMLRVARHTEWVKLETTIREYDPPMSVVFPLARTLGNQEVPAFMDECALIILEMWEAPRGGEPARPGFDFRDWLHLYSLPVSEQIAERQQRRDRVHAIYLASTLRRHQTRVNTLREELIERTNRFRAIQTCRHGFKEELMMKAWHPDRVGKFLETYGWEAFDNLLGVE